MNGMYLIRKTVTFSVMFLLAIASSAQVAQVDVLVAYDASARQELASGNIDLQAFAQSNVDTVNVCLANSGLADDLVIRLVGVYSIATDTSAETLASILASVGSWDGGSAWPGLWKAREDAGADLFVFVTGGAMKNEERGYGYQLAGASGKWGAPESSALSSMTPYVLSYYSDRYCFSVLSLAALREDGGLTMAHELGHNMGCGHTDEPGCYDYSSGWYFGPYVTVMGYADAQHAVAPVFSSPHVLYDSTLTGDATHDNVRTLRNNGPLVASYRSAKKTDAISTDNVYFSKAVTWSGAYRAPDGSLLGMVQLKIGATNKKTLKSKVSGSILTLDGKKHAFKASGVLECTSGTPMVSGIFKDIGTSTITVTKQGFAGVFDDGATLCPEGIGGALSKSTAIFNFGNCPVSIGGNDVLTKFLPSTGQDFSIMGGKWTFKKAAVVKYKDGALDEAAFEKGLAAGKTNLSGLKLSYAAKTGIFKGSFVLYTLTPAGKLKKVTAKVYGLVVGNQAVGQATCKGVSPWAVFVH